jgi:hypothetical protein
LRTGPSRNDDRLVLKKAVARQACSKPFRSLTAELRETISGGPYFSTFYRPEVSTDIQNKLTRSAAVTAGIAAAGLAVGAAAMGVFAIGALAIGALAVRKVAIGGSRVEKLSVGELTVDRLLVKDSVTRE